MSGSGLLEFVRTFGRRSKDKRSKVNSKGRQQGLKEGDLLLAVNGQSTAEMTHADAQRAVKESAGTIELHVQRRTFSGNDVMNGENAVKSRDVSQNASQLNSLEDDVHHNHSWSTDSTSTGSTIIHVSPQSSEEQSSGTEQMWSPNTRKKVNLKLNCDFSSKSSEVQQQQPTETKDSSSSTKETPREQQQQQEEGDTSPVWKPFGAPYEGPQFRPVKLEVSTTTKRTTTPIPQSEQPKKDETDSTGDQKTPESIKADASSPTMVSAKETTSPGTSTATSTAPTFVKSGWSSHLPPSQSPTITLLQKAREGQLPKGAIYIDDKPDSTPLPKNAVLIDQKVTVEGDKVHTDSYYAVPTSSTESTTHTIKASKYDGIGPTEYGIPVGLRTGVKEEYASDWYKTMYKSLHRHKFPNEPSHTVHYGGYMSEPEFDRKDTYFTKYATTDHRRKPEKSVSYADEKAIDQSKKFGNESSVVKHEPQKYKVEPRSIADYEPGRSSLAEKEFQKHEHLGDISPRPHHHHQQGLSRRWANVLLSDGYESDSTLIRKTGRTPQVDPEQQKAWYKEIQKGGEIPFIGLRKSAPEKPAEAKSNKPHPVPHVYGVEPPCFNHKHIPDTASKLTPVRIFRANPVLKFPLKQDCNMSSKPFAPIPPKRCSSKLTPSLKSIASKRSRFPGSSFEASCGNSDSLTVAGSSNSAAQPFLKDINFKSPQCQPLRYRFHSTDQLQNQEFEQSTIATNFRSPSDNCLSVISSPNKNFDSVYFDHSSISNCDTQQDFSLHPRFYNCHISKKIIGDVCSPCHHSDLSADCNARFSTHRKKSTSPSSEYQHFDFIGSSIDDFEKILNINSYEFNSTKSPENLEYPQPDSAEEKINNSSLNRSVSLDRLIEVEERLDRPFSLSPNTLHRTQKNDEVNSFIMEPVLCNASRMKSQLTESSVNPVGFTKDSSVNITNPEYKENSSESCEERRTRIVDKISAENELRSNFPEIFQSSDKGESISTSHVQNACRRIIETLPFEQNYPLSNLLNTSNCLTFDRTSNSVSKNQLNVENCDAIKAETNELKALHLPNKNTNGTIFNITPADSEGSCKDLMISNSQDIIIGKTNNKIHNSEVISNIKNSYNKKLEEVSLDNCFPRMITILPSVVHVSKISFSDLEPQLVYSQPQDNVKQYCKIEINPLKVYLKCFGEFVPHILDENAFDHSCSNINVNGTHKFKACDKHDNNYLGGLVSNKHVYSCKKTHQNISNLASLDGSVLPNSESNRKILRSRDISTQNQHTLQYKTAESQYIKSKRNIFFNQNNATLYHQYISTMVHSVAKSRKFLYLVNFYSGLESRKASFNSNPDKFKVIKIRQFDISWSKSSGYQKWDKEQDKCLKVKRSSVEDLRQLFNSNVNSKKSSHKVFLHYTKLWCNVSVSNLVERYNCLPNTQKNQETGALINYVTCHDGLLKNECPSKHKNVPECSITPHFRNIPADTYSQKQISFVECVTSQYLNNVLPTFPKSISSSCSDVRNSLCLSQHVRSKVQFFEEIVQNNRMKNNSLTRYISAPVKFSKFSHTRNMSWSDLRNIDSCYLSTCSKSVFSPQYLPEKAMSCLDLSFMSECSTVEPSLTNSDRGWASSTNSCFSQDSNDKCSDIHVRTIKTGTVSKIKNKLEKFVMSRSKSVPQNITSVVDVATVNDCGVRFSPVTPTGSVQNLKKMFENNQTSETAHHGHLRSKMNVFGNWRHKQYLCKSEMNVKITPEDNSGFEKSHEIRNCDDLEKADVSCRHFMEEYMKNRIKSIISKFEQNYFLNTTKTTTGNHGRSICKFNVSNFTHRFLNKNSDAKTTNVTEISFSVNNSVASFTVAGQGTAPSKLQERQFKDRSIPSNTSLRSNNWMRLYFPRVANNFPKPYVKKQQNEVCSPLKIRHPASPHQYQETEVNIHYRSPIRNLEKEYIEEDELRKRQEDAMRKFYEEEKRKKHQQELAEIEMRRHSDFFTPSQKSPIPLNRYDNPFDTSYGNRLAPPGMNRGPPPKTMARALYPFTAQTNRELSLNKGDIVYITKQIDKNWYEGEHHGNIGIFPLTYVEIIPCEKANLQPRKATEGEAIVKYNFRAQSPLELSLFKGEKVILLRRMDQNWYEGRIGMKKGIFPVSYVSVLQEPGECTYGSRAISPKPPASPVYSPLINGSPTKMEGPTFNTGLRPLQDKGTYANMPRVTNPPLNLDKLDTKSSLTQSLHIDTYNEPIPYRSLYSYKPQNDDELELKEGDTVYVMEKCDDGWYVGTSLRTGLFGTFPGNYVERI